MMKQQGQFIFVHLKEVIDLQRPFPKKLRVRKKVDQWPYSHLRGYQLRFSSNFNQSTKPEQLISKRN